jgi:hypothetical protein
VTREPLLEVNVSELVPPAGTVAGVNTACTWQGRPVTARVTLPVKPPAGTTLTVVEADAPDGRARDAETGWRLKPAALLVVTVTLIGAVALMSPLVPRTVMLLEAAVADAAAVSVSTDVPPAETAAGANAAVTPAGRPETASETLPLNPPAPVTPILVVVDEPARTVSVAPAALSVKPGAAACATENVSPAMVKVPVRETAVVFAVTE